MAIPGHLRILISQEEAQNFAEPATTNKKKRAKGGLTGEKKSLWETLSLSSWHSLSLLLWRILAREKRSQRS